MDDLLFDQLQESITEAGAIHKGNAAPSREFRFDNPDMKAIRETTGLSQSKFAYLIGVSVIRTVYAVRESIQRTHTD